MNFREKPSWSIWPRNVVKHLVRGQRCLGTLFSCDFKINASAFLSEVIHLEFGSISSYNAIPNQHSVHQSQFFKLQMFSQVHARISNGFPEVRLLPCHLRTKLLAPLGYSEVAGTNLGFYPNLELKSPLPIVETNGDLIPGDRKGISTNLRMGDVNDEGVQRWAPMEALHTL